MGVSRFNTVSFDGLPSTSQCAEPICCAWGSSFAMIQLELCMLVKLGVGGYVKANRASWTPSEASGSAGTFGSAET